MVRLNNSLRCVRVTSDKLLEVGIAQSTSDRQNSIDAIVENQPTCAGDATALVVVATLVVIRQTKSAPVAT